MVDNWLPKVLYVLPLLYAGFVIVTCPCKDLLSCHVNQYYGGLLIAAILPMIGVGGTGPCMK